MLTTRNRKTDGENRREERERAREKGTNINDSNNNKKKARKRAKEIRHFVGLFVCACVGVKLMCLKER